MTTTEIRVPRQGNRAPESKGWAVPMTRSLAAGEAACASCGQACPTPKADDAEAFRIVLGAVTERGTGGFAVTFARCDECTRRRGMWSEWGTRPANAGRLSWGSGDTDTAGERADALGIAVRLLGLEGTPGVDLLETAGLWPLPGDDHAVWGLSFFAYVAAGRDDAQRAERAKTCAASPWGHLTGATLTLVQRLRTDKLAREMHGDAPIILRAADAAYLLDSRAQHRVGDACGACGCSAQSAEWGRPLTDVWFPVSAPVAPLMRGIRAPGAAAGNVALLLCSQCVCAHREGTAPGDELAGDLLRSLGVYADDGGYLRPGVLASHLFASRVLRARALGKPEPAPSPGRWAHLRRDADGEFLPILTGDTPSALAGAGPDTAGVMRAEIDARVSAGVEAGVAAALADPNVIAGPVANAIRGREDAAKASASIKAAATRAKASPPTPAPRRSARF